MITLFTVFLLTAPASDPCTPPANSAVLSHTRAAESAFQGGDAATAASEWERAARLYPLCSGTYRRRLDHIRRALNALATLSADPASGCDAPGLRAATLIHQTRNDLKTLPNSAPRIRNARDDFESRFTALPEAAKAAAALLDAGHPALGLERHARAAPTFGGCPAVRAALTRDILASLTTPTPSACDPKTDAERGRLRDALNALERAEPKTARSTPEYALLTERLVSLDVEGDELATIRARASAATDPDDAAEAWAELARGLPTCSVLLAAKHDAALAAVVAWYGPGTHRESPTRRHALARALLSDVIAAIQSDYGNHASALAEYRSLNLRRDGLTAPTGPDSLASPSPVGPAPKAMPPHPAPPRWIHRNLPARNLLELGVAAGVQFPASHTHELFDGLQQQQMNDMFWRPYRKANPAFGLRFAWYPLSFLGVELEGGVMPTRTLEGADEHIGGKATLYAFRGHIVGQLPFWRITPFVTIGPGFLGTTGALGKDVDFSLNVGGGLKFFVTRHLVLRLDVREVRATRLRVDNGGTNYPEVMLGLSVTLNRRRGATRGKNP